jgi:hypothetical protein
VSIGVKFPVTGAKFEHVPWNTVEAHRAAIQKAFGGTPLERLAAVGGVPWAKLKPIVGQQQEPQQEDGSDSPSQ